MRANFLLKHNIFFHTSQSLSRAWFIASQSIPMYVLVINNSISIILITTTESRSFHVETIIKLMGKCGVMSVVNSATGTWNMNMKAGWGESESGPMNYWQLAILTDAESEKSERWDALPKNKQVNKSASKSRAYLSVETTRYWIPVCDEKSTSFFFLFFLFFFSSFHLGTSKIDQ